MANIVINFTEHIPGRLTITRHLDENKRIVIQGELGMYRYVDEITSIGTDRLSLTGVEVKGESFGSEDLLIVYVFTAKELMIKEDGYINDKIVRLEKIWGDNIE